MEGNRCRPQDQAGVSLALGCIPGHLDPHSRAFQYLVGRGGSCRHDPIQFPLCGLPGLSSHQPANFVFLFIAWHLSQHQELGHTRSPGPSWPQHLQATLVEILHLAEPTPGVGPACCRCWFCTNEPVQKRALCSGRSEPQWHHVRLLPTRDKRHRCCHLHACAGVGPREQKGIKFQDM